MIVAPIIQGLKNRVKEIPALFIATISVSLDNLEVNKITAINNANGISFCVLGPDVQARGIEGKLADGIKVVDYDGFVDLVAEHDTVQAWL